MTDKLVEFNTAVLAKEKGFNIPCNTHCFIGNTGKIVFEKSVHCIDWGNRPNVKTIQKYSRPTQSLLQKWLREVHNIFVYVEPTSLGDNAPFIKDSWGKVFYDPWKNNNKGVSYEYEEALEFALLEGLKLIKDENIKTNLP